MLSSFQKRQYNPRYKLAHFIWGFSFLLCGIYFLGAMARSEVAFESLGLIPKTLVILWKGLAEILLILAALIVARTVNALKLVFYVFLIFIAEMALALEVVPLAGFVFALAHLFVTFVYLTSSYNSAKPLLKIIGVLPILLVLVMVIYSTLIDNFQIIVIFPIFSAIATLGALRSNYPWFLNGIGTALIWMSDMLFVFAILSLGSAVSVGWLVWLTFSSGLLLIVLGLINHRIQLS